MVVKDKLSETNSPGKQFSDDFREVHELQKTKAKLREEVTLNMLASMVEALSEQLDEMSQNEKVFYDKELGKVIGTSLDKFGESLVTFAKNQPKTDLTPITKTNEGITKIQESMASLMREISYQNKQLIEAVSKKDNTGYETLLRQTMDMINKSNEFIRKGFPVIDNSGEIAMLREALVQPKEPKVPPPTYEFDVWRENGRIVKIIAKPK